jgi:hypothetical protein
MPSHSFALLGAYEVTPKSPFWPGTLQPLALVANPKLGLRHSRTMEKWHTSFFGFFCSLNHVFWTLFPFHQFVNQLKIHNYSPIDKFSMIYYGDHYGKHIIKILHLIFLVDTGK